MLIQLDNVGRRYNRDWIFRAVDFEFQEGNSYAILGNNGSGKSTLLQIISGHLSPSEGFISFFHKGEQIVIDSLYQQVSLLAPYVDIIEDFSLQEVIDFHFQFKELHHSLPDHRAIVSLLGFEKHVSKPVKYFSSGMKQRLKLALAFCSQTQLLLLDEPTMNLDTQGVDWYLSLVDRFAADRLLIVASNQKEEYDFCSNILNIIDYKK